MQREWFNNKFVMKYDIKTLYDQGSSSEKASCSSHECLSHSMASCRSNTNDIQVSKETIQEV